MFIFILAYLNKKLKLNVYSITYRIFIGGMIMLWHEQSRYYFLVGSEYSKASFASRLPGATPLLRQHALVTSEVCVAVNQCH